ncbi:MAG: ABC transporter ATP-binding protein [Clostridia bacterium]|nr:ABC transporter ATP-binding protein [Clostridia bacterium]
MNEKPVVLKIENVKKRYMIKRIEDKNLNKSEKFKKGLKNFFSSKSSKEPFYALNGVSFEVRQGEKVGIIGKNGAGKSTLLKNISRITEPTDGRIEFLGKISSMLEVGTGFNGELTGRENVYLNGAILGMTKAEVDKKFDDILEFSEVGKFIDTPVKRYSSGMFVRLAFAVAANLESDILLVDEVLAVGDTRFQKKCINKMLEIASSGRTILFVSHQMNTIRQLCDRVIVLKEGKVIFDGDVEEGIKIYNDDSNIEKKNHYDYSNTPRIQTFINNHSEIKTLDILNSDNCIYGINDPIEFNIHCKTKKENIGDISLRISIWREDETPVSSFFSKPFTNINTITDFNVKVKIKEHNLAPGLYRVILTLCGNSSNKFCVDDMDNIYPAFVFEILNKDGTSHQWARVWGNSEIKDVDVSII